MKKYTEKFTALYMKSYELTNLTHDLRMPIFSESLSVDEINAFGYLAEFGAASMKELSEVCKVKPNVMTGTILKLQKKEMVIRYEDSEDRRIVMVEATPKWRKIHETYLKELEKTSRLIVESIGEKEFDSLLKTLAETTYKLQKEAATIIKNV